MKFVVLVRLITIKCETCFYRIAFQIFVFGLIAVAYAQFGNSENSITGWLRSFLTAQRTTSSQTDLRSVTKFLRSAKPDESHRSIGGRNRFTDKIDEIDENSRNSNLGSRLVQIYLNSLLNRK